jgi:hypothetical protein
LATVTELRDNGATVTNVATPIIEPLAAQEVFGGKLRRFGDHYNTSPNSHLYRFLVALCGEAGAGSLKKELLLPKLFERLESTQYLNLDRLYGDALALPRLSAEVYSVDPENQSLTQAQWDDVHAKDAAYRERCLTWMRAILAGPTVEGLKLAGQAATGVECDVFEQYKYLDNTGVTNIGQFNSRNEFIIIPRTPTITEQDRRRIARLVDQLKPTGTLHTVFLGNDLRTAKSVRASSATSNRFYIKKLVTGRTDVTWPPIDTSQGLWIVGGTQTEAPTFAFMDRQEMVTFITITSSSASSEHVGLFNEAQRQLFANLTRNTDEFLYFSADRAQAKNIAPLNIQQGWVNTSAGEAHDTIVANLHYPLYYFTLEGLQPEQDDTPDTFWSSVEKLAPATDYLILNLGSARPINFITWEMTAKPFDFVIEYDDGAGNWKPVVDDGRNTYSLAMPYIASAENPWTYFEYHFKQVTSARIRITFTRRTDSWPLPSSTPFPYSVDIRGLRVMNLITSASDFITDTGTDILGNTYTTQLSQYTPDLTTDGLPTYWQSQPNPTKNAVEALYFDLRITPHTGTQAFLDGITMEDLDNRSQQDVELYYSDGQVIDEVFVDPVFPGANMKFYYSNDDYPSWDDKLWSPVPRDYILRKGYHALPSPQKVKYFKVEFSNLPAIPYQPVEYPSMPKVRYRQFPTWVTDYFSNVYPTQPIPNGLTQIETLNYEPLDLFQKVDDRMGQTFEQMRDELEQDHDPEIATQIEELLAMQVDPTPQRQIESDIQYNSTVMWQKDLLSQVDSTRALGRVATRPRLGIDDTGFNSELGLPAYTPPLQQSVRDLTNVALDKMIPPMWFPRMCRHGYKILEGSIDSKVAFYVGIRSVQFYRRNYNVLSDEPVYIETLDDTAHTASNDFTQGEFAYYIGN